MNEFTLRETIKSVTIDKNIIKDIVKYVNNAAEDIVSGSNYNSSYSIELSTITGVMKYKSIEDMNFDKFDNDVEEMKVNFHFDNMHISLSFSKYKWSSYIYISASIPNSKEISTGIKSEILKLLYKNKNLNFIFHGKETVIISFFSRCVNSYFGQCK